MMTGSMYHGVRSLLLEAVGEVAVQSELVRRELEMWD